MLIDNEDNELLLCKFAVPLQLCKMGHLLERNAIPQNVFKLFLLVDSGS